MMVPSYIICRFQPGLSALVCIRATDYVCVGKEGGEKIDLHI